jgi:predicted chitinase
MTNNEIIVYCRLKKDGYTKQSIAAVMGVVGGESGFQYLKEFSYLNNTNSSLRAIFAAFAGQTDGFINQCKTSDYNFFNCVYGGQAGNSPTEGYKYLGRGFNGITFKGNYEYVQLGIKNTYNEEYDLVNRPELLENTDIAAKALSYWFRMVKNMSDFETAFQEAYRQNAGPGYSFAQYQSFTNPVHVQGIPLKRGYGQAYLSRINNGEFDSVCGNNTGSNVLSSGLILSFPIVFFFTLASYYLYKKFS